MSDLLSDPFFLLDAFYETIPHGVPTFASGGSVVAANNGATYQPFYLPIDATVYALTFRATNGTGNYDIGLYDGSFNRLASTGSVAMSAAGNKTLSLADLALTAGTLYYAALAMSSTSGTLLRMTATGFRWGASGLGQEASALPLPATAAPTIYTTTAAPLFSIGVR